MKRRCYVNKNDEFWQLYRALIMGGSGSEKNKCIVKFNKYQLDADKTYLYAKDP